MDPGIADDFGPHGRSLVDERRIAHAPGGMAERTVDVTHLSGWVDAQGRAGTPWGFALLVVRAVALAVARRPELQTLVAGYRRLQAGTVDVGLATSGLDRALPLVIESADRQTVRALGEMVGRASAAPESGGAGAPGAWVRFIPFAFVRLALLRWLSRSFRLQRRRSGTFHVTCAAGADVVAPLRFHTGSALGAGRIRDAFVAVDGRMEARRVATLTVVADHVAMDGVRAALLLSAVAEILESEELAPELL
jgi:pyruvate/2-oxoglutarate dehydrogenase complex dihydrolipoamide acyltransferase (E2) component